MHYGLYFERFMDPDRDEMPDIDVDICQNGRADVINYVREKYGHVAQIITFGTLKARAAVKDVSRVLGLPLRGSQPLTKLIPNELKMTIDKALEQEPELRKRYDNDETSSKVIDVSRKLEGWPGTRASTRPAWWWRTSRWTTSCRCTSRRATTGSSPSSTGRPSRRSACSRWTSSGCAR
jgi:DNA polymerase III alpha subunit